MDLSLTAVEPTPAPQCELPEFDEIHRRCVPAVRRILRRHGVREHEIPDVEQEVFLIVHRRLPACETPAAPWSWVHGIAWHVGRAHCRHRLGEEARLDHEVDPAALAAPLDDEPGPSDETQRALLVSLLGQVRNPDRRDVLRRHHVAGEPLDVIASELGRPLRTVEWQRRKGERELKAALDRHLARERHGARKARRAVVLPVAGVVDLRYVLVAIACVAVVIAAVLFHLSTRSASVPLELRPEVTLAVASASSAAEAPASPPEASPSSSCIPLAPVVLPRPARAAHAVSEHEILDKAQRALEAGDPAVALAAVEEHAQLFHGTGLLAQERERLRKIALRAAGRHRQAATSSGTRGASTRSW